MAKAGGSLADNLQAERSLGQLVKVHMTIIGWTVGKEIGVQFDAYTAMPFARVCAGREGESDPSAAVPKIRLTHV